ncbi:hypothetical protein LRS04_18875 [Phenylobacterium sp. J367]|nr:hypothetical protein [Phenylobacterium sp. J367]
MRQDKAFKAGEAVTSRAFARLLSGAFDRLITVDPHLHRFKALSDLYTIPCVTLHSADLLGAWIRSEAPNALVIGPDSESEQWASDVAAAADAPVVVLRKERFGDRDVRITFPDLTAFAGRQPVLIDDIASSGRTLTAAARELGLRGVPAPDLRHRARDLRGRRPDRGRRRFGARRLHRRSAARHERHLRGPAHRDRPARGSR